jgi:M6 family metalloprotease-like protein
LRKRFKVNVTPLLACLILCLSVGASAESKSRVPGLLRAQKTGNPRGVAAPPSSSLNSYQQQRLIDYFAGFTSALDTLRVIALQVQFADSVMGGQPGSERDAVRDSTWFANEMRHVEQYYRGASRSRTEIAWRVEGRLYNLPERMKYYGDDDVEEERVVELAQTLIDSADVDVDFSLYDTIMIIHAGAGQETDIAGDSPEQIWSSFYDLGDIQAVADTLVPGLVTGDSLDGEPYYASNFCIVPESGSQDFQTIGSLGIWVFEVGSRLGLLPMFDSTPRGFQDSQGTGNFCVMGYGLWIGPEGLDGFVPGFPCAFNRLISGWIDPVTVDASDISGDSTLTLTDMNTGLDTETVSIKVPITENEYYLVVNRVHDANFDSLFTFGDLDSNMVPENTDSFEGADFDFYLTSLTNPTSFRYDEDYGFDIKLQYTGSGVYVWHIDEKVILQNIDSGFLPNDFVDRKGVDLEEADGVQDMDTGGFVGFIYGNHFDSFRSGDGNANTFGPSTSPNSTSNGGAVTGITIGNASVIGHDMTVDLSRTIPYEENRTRWTALGESQPATTGDIDGDGDLEIVVLADTGLVYVFNSDGGEYDDADADPETIAPYISVPGAVWAGPPALGNIDDGVSGAEIVAAATDGRLFAWTWQGDLVTGDVLYQGQPLATSPLLVDLTDSGVDYVVIVESANDTLTVGFVAPNGNWSVPDDPTFGPLWPLAVQGQLAAPLSLARTRIGETDGQTGVVLVSVDTLSATSGAVFAPAMWSRVDDPGGQPAAQGWSAQGWSASWPLAADLPASEQLPSPPAAGDIDGDANDEVVLTIADGRLMVFDDGIGDNQPSVTQLRAGNPSGPALGDVDLDGTLEIALWDDEYLYLKKWNGSDLSNWPIAIVPALAGSQPFIEKDRGLEGPAIGDFDGDGAIEAVYPLQDGTFYGLEWDAAPMTGFPRAGPAGAKATPTVAALDGTGGASLVTVGFTEQIERYDTVVDTATTTPSLTLSIQTLPGSDAADLMFWPAFQAGSSRQGIATDGAQMKTAADPVQAESFMIYPNPVPGPVVHARITLNASARVMVEIYNFEGERAVEQEYDANVAGLIGTPFDQEIDVSALKSGVYFLRLEIESSGGTEKLVKPFAIRR